MSDRRVPAIAAGRSTEELVRELRADAEALATIDRCRALQPRLLEAADRLEKLERTNARLESLLIEFCPLDQYNEAIAALEEATE